MQSSIDAYQASITFCELFNNPNGQRNGQYFADAIMFLKRMGATTDYHILYTTLKFALKYTGTDIAPKTLVHLIESNEEVSM